jgi:hypothetical protein
MIVLEALLFHSKGYGVRKVTAAQCLSRCGQVCKTDDDEWMIAVFVLSSHTTVSDNPDDTGVSSQRTFQLRQILTDGRVTFAAPPGSCQQPSVKPVAVPAKQEATSDQFNRQCWIGKPLVAIRQHLLSPPRCRLQVLFCAYNVPQGTSIRL